MKNRLLIILFAMLLSWYSFAQDDQSQSEDQAAQADEQSVEAEEAENGTEEADESDAAAAEEEEAPGRFIPSEQISQDLGVSFPVDI